MKTIIDANNVVHKMLVAAGDLSDQVLSAEASVNGVSTALHRTFDMTAKLFVRSIRSAEIIALRCGITLHAVHVDDGYEHHTWAANSNGITVLVTAVGSVISGSVESGTEPEQTDGGVA